MQLHEFLISNRGWVEFEFDKMIPELYSVQLIAWQCYECKLI